MPLMQAPTSALQLAMVQSWQSVETPLAQGPTMPLASTVLPSGRETVMQCSMVQVMRAVAFACVAGLAWLMHTPKQAVSLPHAVAHVIVAKQVAVAMSAETAMSAGTAMSAAGVDELPQPQIVTNNTEILSTFDTLNPPW